MDWGRVYQQRHTNKLSKWLGEGLYGVGSCMGQETNNPAPANKCPRGNPAAWRPVWRTGKARHTAVRFWHTGFLWRQGCRIKDVSSPETGTPTSHQAGKVSIASGRQHRPLRRSDGGSSGGVGWRTSLLSPPLRPPPGTFPSLSPEGEFFAASRAGPLTTL